MRLTICTSAQVVACSLFRILSQPTKGFGNLDESLTKRGLESVYKAKKRARGSAESAASKGGALEKLVVAIPDTSGMTYTAPMVTKLQ